MQQTTILRPGTTTITSPASVVRRVEQEISSNNTLWRTIIIHEDGDTPPVEAGEFERITIPIDVTAGGRMTLENDLATLQAQIANAADNYRGLSTDPERQAFVLSTYDNLIEALEKSVKLQLRNF